MRKNLDPRLVPPAVADHLRGGESPSKGSLYHYVVTAEKAMSHGLRSIAEYQRKLPQIEAQAERETEDWFRKTLGCRN